ncbi:hypothetical protein PAMP_021365 [Pampus punctatissimus]
MEKCGCKWLQVLQAVVAADLKMTRRFSGSQSKDDFEVQTRSTGKSLRASWFSQLIPSSQS